MVCVKVEEVVRGSGGSSGGGMYGEYVVVRGEGEGSR